LKLDHGRIGFKLCLQCELAALQHGYPDPITSPAGVPRRSLASYYYTHGRPNWENAAGVVDDAGMHTTLWQSPSGKCLRLPE